MAPLLIVLGCVLVLVIITVLVYARRKGNRLRAEISELERARLDEIFEDVVKRLKPSYPELDPNNFGDTMALLEKELGSNGEKFVALLQRGDYFEFWIVNLGVFLGELVRRNAAAPAAWVRDEHGGWKVKFNLKSTQYTWDPFTEAHKQYLKGAFQLLMGMALLKNMK